MPTCSLRNKSWSLLIDDRFSTQQLESVNNSLLTSQVAQLPAHSDPGFATLLTAAHGAHPTQKQTAGPLPNQGAQTSARSNHTLCACLHQHAVAECQHM